VAVDRIGDGDPVIKIRSGQVAVREHMIPVKEVMLIVKGWYQSERPMKGMGVSL
jgi:hypothetical protein